MMFHSLFACVATVALAITPRTPMAKMLAHARWTRCSNSTIDPTAPAPSSASITEARWSMREASVRRIWSRAGQHAADQVPCRECVQAVHGILHCDAGASGQDRSRRRYPQVSAKTRQPRAQDHRAPIGPAHQRITRSMGADGARRSLDGRRDRPAADPQRGRAAGGLELRARHGGVV